MGIGALLAASTNAFTWAPAARSFVNRPAETSVARQASVDSLAPGAQEVDAIGHGIAVKNLLKKIESSGLLTQVAQSGLLSKAQTAGVKLANLEPLLELAASNPDILVLVEASGPELIPILPKVVDLAPSAP